MSEDVDESEEIAALRAELVKLVLDDLYSRPGQPLPVALQPDALDQLVGRWDGVLKPLKDQVATLAGTVGELETKAAEQAQQVAKLSGLGETMETIQSTLQAIAGRPSPVSVPLQVDASEINEGAAQLAGLIDRLEKMLGDAADGEKTEQTGATGAASPPKANEGIDVPSPAPSPPPPPAPPASPAAEGKGKGWLGWRSFLSGPFGRAKEDGSIPMPAPGAERRGNEKPSVPPMLIVGLVVVGFIIVVFFTLSRDSGVEPAATNHFEQPQNAAAPGDAEKSNASAAETGNEAMSPDEANDLVENGTESKALPANDTGPR